MDGMWFRIVDESGVPYFDKPIFIPWSELRDVKRTLLSSLGFEVLIWF